MFISKMILNKKMYATPLFILHKYYVLYSKKSISPINQIFAQSVNSIGKTEEDKENNFISNNNIKTEIEIIIPKEMNNHKANKLEENDPLINTDLEEYINFLETINQNFKNSYGNAYIKNKLSFECIINALFNGDLSGVITKEITNNSGVSFFDAHILNYIDKLKNIPKEELQEADYLKELYNNIQSDAFLKKAEKIFSSLSKGRKYQKIIAKLKENKDKSIYGIFIEKLKVCGGFDEQIAELILKIITKYLSTYEKIVGIEKEIEKIPKYIEKYSQLSFEISQLKDVKKYINSTDGGLKENNSLLGLNKIEKIKDNFQNNADFYINQEKNDENYKKMLKEIKSFIEKKDFKCIIESVKLLLKDNESDFYVDDSITLSTYCWGIQNGHDLVLDY